MNKLAMINSGEIVLELFTILVCALYLIKYGKLKIIQTALIYKIYKNTKLDSLC